MARAGLGPLLPAEDRDLDVLCLGLNATDYLCQVPRFPERGSKLEMERMVTSGGGQSATAACALARLGHRTAYAGICGDDPAGVEVRPRLEKFGVRPLGLVVQPGAGSQQAFIMVESGSGERTIIWQRDPACTLKPEHISEQLIADARVLHLDGHFLEASVAAARMAKKHGLLVSLDGERIYPGSEELVGMCDVVVGSVRYPQRITGIEDPRRSLEALAEMGPAWVGRTRGAAGAELLAGGRYHEHPGYKVEAVDTTGAGDVFHAGMVHAVLSGCGPAEALDVACALAAISVTALGGRSALAHSRQLAEFMARHKS